MQGGHSVTERAKVYQIGVGSPANSPLVTNESLFAISIRRILGLKLQKDVLKGEEKHKQPTEAALLSLLEPWGVPLEGLKAKDIFCSVDSFNAPS